MPTDIEQLNNRLRVLENTILPFAKYTTNPLQDMYDDFLKTKSSGSTGGSTAFYTAQGSRTTGAGTGTQAITGVGFKPKMIKILSFQDGAGHSACWGTAVDGGNTVASVFYYLTSASNWDWDYYTSSPINLQDNTGSGVVFATIDSFDADGFTINWQTLSVNCVYQFECYK